MNNETLVFLAIVAVVIVWASLKMWARVRINEEGLEDHYGPFVVGVMKGFLAAPPVAIVLLVVWAIIDSTIRVPEIASRAPLEGGYSETVDRPTDLELNTPRVDLTEQAKSDRDEAEDEFVEDVNEQRDPPQ